MFNRKITIKQAIIAMTLIRATELYFIKKMNIEFDHDKINALKRPFASLKSTINNKIHPVTDDVEYVDDVVQTEISGNTDSIIL